MTAPPFLTISASFLSTFLSNDGSGLALRHELFGFRRIPPVVSLSGIAHLYETGPPRFLCTSTGLSPNTHPKACVYRKASSYINSTEDENQPNDAPAPSPEEKEEGEKGNNNLVDDEEELQAIIPRPVLDLLDDIADDGNDDGDDGDDGKGGGHDGDRDDNDDDND